MSPSLANGCGVGVYDVLFIVDLCGEDLHVVSCHFESFRFRYIVSIG